MSGPITRRSFSARADLVYAAVEAVEERWEGRLMVPAADRAAAAERACARLPLVLQTADCRGALTFGLDHLAARISHPKDAADDKAPFLPPCMSPAQVTAATSLVARQPTPAAVVAHVLAVARGPEAGRLIAVLEFLDVALPAATKHCAYESLAAVRGADDVRIPIVPVAQRSPRSAGGRYGPRGHVQYKFEPNKPALNPRLSHFAEVKLAQALWATRVADPYDLAAVTAYLQGLVDGGADLNFLAPLWSSYLSAHFKHAGSAAYPGYRVAERTARAQQIVAELGSTRDGRRFTDCEGYSYISRAVLGGLKKNGATWLTAHFVKGDGHMTALLGDGERWLFVNNDAASVSDSAGLVEHLARRINFGKPSTHVITTAQDAAGALHGPHGEAKVGVTVFDGGDGLGTVDEAMALAHVAFIAAQPDDKEKETKEEDFLTLWFQQGNRVLPSE
jgi:hypothetical protein